MTRTSAFAVLRRTLSTIAVAVLALSAVILSAFTAPRIVGYETLVVLGSSMGDVYPVGSLVVVRPVAPDDVHVGDVILMRTPGVPAVLHRVVELRREGGHVLVETKGDANATRDPADYVLPSKVPVAFVGIPKAGNLISAAHTVRGWILLQALPATLLAVWLLVQVWWGDDRSRRPRPAIGGSCA
jgi:signal peptidase